MLTLGYLFRASQLLEESINRKKATVHNDELKVREEYAASLAIGARANFLRDKAALVAARKKYSALAALLDDPATDHQQVNILTVRESFIFVCLHSFPKRKHQRMLIRFWCDTRDFLRSRTLSPRSLPTSTHGKSWRKRMRTRWRPRRACTRRPR
jgi:hypothetical protein